MLNHFIHEQNGFWKLTISYIAIQESLFHPNPIIQSTVYNHPSPPDTNSPGHHCSPNILTPINIQPYQHGNVTFWFFPCIISQSTILGRTGSNACTLIAFSFGKLFYSVNVDIPVITSPLSQTWVYQIIVQGILLDNRIYGSIVQNSPQTFGVVQALQVSTTMNNIIGHTTVGPEFPVSIIPEAIPSALSCFLWKRALLQGRTASV